jgi:hypothetical protein
MRPAAAAVCGPNASGHAPRDVSKLEAVLDLARRFGPIWPQTPQRTGYRGTHGSKDATCDEAIIRGWPADAVPALITGETSGVVALDVDVKNGRNGLDSLEELGISLHPVTPTAHTPSGGLHLFFKWPGHPVPTNQDKIGSGLEVKGDNSWITLPPGPGRRWDPHLGPNTPLAPMPAWMMPRTPERPRQTHRQERNILSKYGEAALDEAVRLISTVPAGKQEKTLNAECYSIGQLAAGREIPVDLAIKALLLAARRMRSYARPWNQVKLENKVRRAFDAGMALPRRAPDARR